MATRRRRRRGFGFTFKIPEAAYRKAARKRGSRTNRDRAVIEVYRFVNRKKAAPFMAYLKGHKVTNWTGLKLCDVTSRKEGRRGFHSSTIVTVQAKCIDGRRYVGTGPGDNMYLRLRPKRGR
jgi:hypothetical protein